MAESCNTDRRDMAGNCSTDTQDMGRELHEAHVGKASKKSSYLNFLISMQDVPCAYLEKRNENTLMEQFI